MRTWLCEIGLLIWWSCENLRVFEKVIIIVVKIPWLPLLLRLRLSLWWGVLKETIKIVIFEAEDSAVLARDSMLIMFMIGINPEGMRRGRRRARLTKKRTIRVFAPTVRSFEWSVVLVLALRGMANRMVRFARRNKEVYSSVWS